MADCCQLFQPLCCGEEAAAGVEAAGVEATGVEAAGELAAGDQLPHDPVTDSDGTAAFMVGMLRDAEAEPLQLFHPAIEEAAAVVVAGVV